MLNCYQASVTYTVTDTYYITASSQDEALDKAKDLFIGQVKPDEHLLDKEDPVYIIEELTT